MRRDIPFIDLESRHEPLRLGTDLACPMARVAESGSEEFEAHSPRIRADGCRAAGVGLAGAGLAAPGGPGRSAHAGRLPR